MLKASYTDFGTKPTPFAMVGFVAFLFALTLCACRQDGAQQAPSPGSGQTPSPGSLLDHSVDLQDLQVRLAPHKGDIDEMDKRGMVRALVTFNKVGFFFDNGRPRGMTYDALLDFEEFLNRKLRPKDRTNKDRIKVVLVPTTTDSVASDLLV